MSNCDKSRLFCAQCWYLLPCRVASAHHRAVTGLVMASLVLACGTVVAQAPAAPLVDSGLVATQPVAVASSEDAGPEIGADWVRLRRDAKDEPVAMETAIVRYVPKGGDKSASPTKYVDLVAAIHVGDAAYYDELNRRFEHYDALLYELVAPEGTVVERGRGTPNSHPVGAMQNGMKSMLALEHQLDRVDYTKANFVHADMSPDQFLQAMKDRNEGFLEMYMRLLGHSLAHQSEIVAEGESPTFELIGAMLSNDRERKLKIVLAKQLAETESLLVSFGGEEGSVLITDRNKKALKVLREQLAAGRRHVGIFYGAGHLADMDRRLRADFDLMPVEITWLTAWDLAPKR